MTEIPAAQPAPFEASRDGFTISTDPARLDAEAIQAYLDRSYWAAGIPMAVVQRFLANSLCFGLYEGTRQAGFARVITDRATFAYLCDVFVLEEYRGRSLGKWLIKTVLAHPDLQGLRRFHLVTRDAHGLYGPHGFRPVEGADRHMEITRPDIYQKAGGQKPDGGS